jgi:GntR family transcriptional regulator
MSQPAETPVFAYRPLYAQVKDRLVRRLIDGVWQPGQLIPSEMELARELGVSQGTIRKALDAMTAENLLLRRQGRGTYVAEPEDSRILFQFFRLMPDGGEAVFPTSRILARTAAAAEPAEAERLRLPRGAGVVRIERVRALGERPVMVETLSLPQARFGELATMAEIPNNVYRLYSQRWSVTIGRALERLKAIAATPADAAELGCAPGTPLLEISRIAYDLEGNPVELRVSRCLTDSLHYSSELR